MNFYFIVISGYIVLAVYLVYILNRDRNHPAVFFGINRRLSWFFIIILAVGLVFALESLIEPYFLYTRRIELKTAGLKTPLKIVFVSDIQAGKHKKTTWVEKLTKKIEAEKPDLVLIGGDLINNEGTFEDESRYLEPLRALTKKTKIFYVLGNHEYGIGNWGRYFDKNRTGDRSAEVVKRMEDLGAVLLKNDLACLEQICLFGLDEGWGGHPDYKNLQNWDKNIPLIFLAHNPDAILSFPSIKKPALALSGHTHGGQIWLPFYGPVGDAGTDLGRNFYHGLYDIGGARLYVSNGAGESGGPVRLFNLPEIVVINLIPAASFQHF